MNERKIMKGIVASLAGALIVACSGCGGGGGGSTPAPVTSVAAMPVPTGPLYNGTCAVASCSSDLVSAFHVDDWFWSSPIVYDESVLPIAGKTAYPLWRTAISIQTVRNRQTGKVYAPNADYQLANGQLIIPATSNIPLVDTSWLTTADPTNPPLWDPLTKEGGQLRISEDYQPQQVAVTYTTAANGTPPTPSQTTKLFLAKLNAGKAASILFAGDSITEGDDSTAVDKQAPLQPGYAELTTAYLAQKYPGLVTANNASVAGEGSTYFTQNLQLFAKPYDVVVIALGMNDPPGRVTPAQFQANIMAMIGAARVANPASEIVLVASWPSNPDWILSNNALLDQYRTVEYSIANSVSNVFVADFETTSDQVLANASFYDITGSGVAHPSDFMYVMFAQILLKTLLGL